MKKYKKEEEKEDENKVQLNSIKEWFSQSISLKNIKII